MYVYFIFNHTVVYFDTNRLMKFISVLYQRRYNKLHNSIYGLSYDLYIISVISHLTSIYVTLNYSFSPLIRHQLAERFPLFYLNNPPPISTLLVFFDTINLVTDTLVFLQLFQYSKSRHIYQGISSIAVYFLSLSLIFNIVTFGCSLYNLPLRNMGIWGIFYLDHINYIWVLGNIFSSGKFLPQIFLNYMGSNTYGISNKYLIIRISGTLLLLLSIPFPDNSTPFYMAPFNYTPMFVPVSHMLSFCIILYQKQYLYLGNPPHLPRINTIKVRKSIEV